MMSGRESVVLDTNIVIAFFRQDEKVLKPIRDGAKMNIPVIVAGELYFGVEKSQQQQANRQKIDKLIQEVTLLYCLDDTPQHYARIKSELKKKGTPIPENDIWIAAIAQNYALPLVSRDRHFQHISNLSLIQW